MRGTVAGSGTAGLAVAHYGSNNMITFRYLLKNVPMKVADSAFTADGVKFPAGSFIVTGSAADLAGGAARTVDSLGLTAAALSSLPQVPSHEANVPRVAIYSQWNGTQELGWYRYTFDQFHIPYRSDLQGARGKGQPEEGLRRDRDGGAEHQPRGGVRAQGQAPAALRTERQVQVPGHVRLDARHERRIRAGRSGRDRCVPRCAGARSSPPRRRCDYPIDFGLARSAYGENPAGVTAQKPLVMARITRTDSPIFYGYAADTIPIKFDQGAQVFHVGVADQASVLAEYVGGDASRVERADDRRRQAARPPFVMDISKAYDGHGRVIMFANNPVYRWQNHGEFNMMFNAIINWDHPTPAKTEAPGGK